MITRLTKHDAHEIETRRLTEGPHYAELRCRCCNKHIQWLSKAELKRINRIIYRKPHRIDIDDFL